uniref:hypothetical protein n=1 Tax=Castellaniella defragrans TaxID=75697 RepID=UPI00333FC0A2
MNAKKYLSCLVLAAFAFLVGVISIMIYPFQLSGPNVMIDVFDRRYACGDCYIRFGISEIHSPQNGGDEAESKKQPGSPERFDGWDVLVVFKGDDSYLSSYQNERFSKDHDCAWPTFRLTGQFKRRLIYSLLYDGDRYDGIYFDAHSGVAVNTESACKTLPIEVELP